MQMLYCRLVLLSAVLAVPAACYEDAPVFISQKPYVVSKLISVDIGDNEDDLQTCGVQKSPLVTHAPDTSTPAADLTVKLQKMVSQVASEQVSRAKQEILQELKLAQQERFNWFDQGRGQCEKFLFTRQQNASGPWDVDSSEWQTGTNDEYLRYLKTTGQLSREDGEDKPWDPQVRMTIIIKQINFINIYIITSICTNILSRYIGQILMHFLAQNTHYFAKMASL
jgi:hypothetical protein